MTQSDSLAGALRRGAYAARRCWHEAFIYLDKNTGVVMLSSFGGRHINRMEFASVDSKAKDWYVVWSPPPGAG